MDNIFIERLWRSLKYEEVYLQDYASVPEARAGIGNWFRFYNHKGHIRASTTGHRRTCTWDEKPADYADHKEGDFVELGGSAPKPPRFSPHFSRRV